MWSSLAGVMVQRAERLSRMERLSGAAAMMEIKVNVSGCADIAASVYKYPHPKSGRCTCLCECVMG